MGFDLAGMGEVAQGMSNMRDAQDRQRASAQLAEDNAGRLRAMQQAEVDRRLQAKQYADQAASNTAIRQNSQYSNVPINPDATNLPAPAPAPVGNAGLAVSYPPAAAPATPTTPAVPSLGITPAPAAAPVIASTPAQAVTLQNNRAMTHVPLLGTDKNKSAWDNLKAMAGNKYTAEQQATLALPRVDPTQPASFAQLATQSPTAKMPSRPFTPTPISNAAVASAPIASLPAAVQQWAPQVTQEAGKYGVDPNIALWHMKYESNGDVNARPPVNPTTGRPKSTAASLYQITDPAAQDVGLVNKFNPASNITAYMQIMQHNLGQLGGDYPKALAAYHDGLQAVKDDISEFGDNWRKGLLPGTSKYVDNILAGSGHPAAFAADTGEPMPSTLIPPTAPATPAAQKIVLDNRKVWNTVASSATPQEDALRENKLRFYNLRIRSSNDPAEQQALMDKIDAVTKEGDEANMFHAYMGASNGDPAGIQALAGQYNEATGTQIGITMQGDKMVVYNKGADGNPNVLMSGTPHDMASQLYTSMSPMLRAKQAEVTAEAAKAEVQEAPKRATALQTEALKATTTSNDKQLGNLTKIAYAKIMSNGKFRAALAASGIKQNEVKLYPSTIPGQVTFATKGGNIYTYQEGKSGNGFSSPPSIKPVDMSAANISQQVSSIDPNAMADSPSDVFPEDQ